MKDKLKQREYQRRYRETHREHIRARDREWKRKKYDQYHEQNRIWRLNHPEKVKEYAQRYRKSGAQKWSQIKSRYGISQEQYKTILSIQQSRCPICGEDFGNRKPYIDHNHENGIVRGILHRECNSLLGFVEEKIVRLENAIKYLKNYENNKQKAAVVRTNKEGSG